jgi:hypothetical protein
LSNNNFPENFEFGVHKYRHLLDIFYEHYCYQRRFVCLDEIVRSPFSDFVQRKLKVDTIIQISQNVSYGVEEKVVAWPQNGQPYSGLFLETDSCTNPGRESKGWMALSKADLLLYALEIDGVGLVIFLMDFLKLKRWFWREYLPALPRPDYGRSVMAEANCTEGRVVATEAIVRAVPTRCFLVTHSEEFHELSPDVDIQQLRTAYQSGPQRLRDFWLPSQRRSLIGFEC